MEKEFVHRCRHFDHASFFYDVMVNGRKITCEFERESFEASYFAMCLLIPEETFKEALNLIHGRLEGSYIDAEKIELLSSIFNVEENLIVCRIISMMDKKANQKSSHNKGKKSKKVKMLKNKRKYKN